MTPQKKNAGAACADALGIDSIGGLLMISDRDTLAAVLVRLLRVIASAEAQALSIRREETDDVIGALAIRLLPGPVGQSPLRDANPQTPLAAFLRSCVRHDLIELKRKVTRESRHLLSEDIGIAGSSRSGLPAHSIDLDDLISACTPKQQCAVRQRLDGKTLREVARDLDISSSAAAGRIQRSRRALASAAAFAKLPSGDVKSQLVRDVLAELDRCSAVRRSAGGQTVLNSSALPQGLSAPELELLDLLVRHRTMTRIAAGIGKSRAMVHKLLRVLLLRLRRDS